MTKQTFEIFYGPTQSVAKGETTRCDQFRFHVFLKLASKSYICFSFKIFSFIFGIFK